MSQLLVCPNCGKGLRTTMPALAGSRIKCPACATVFTAGDNEAAVAVQSRRPAPQASPAPPQAKPRRSSGVVDDFDDWAPSNRTPSADRSIARKRGSKLGLVLTLSGCLAVVAILSVTAFVWPGFLVPGRPASQARSLLVYVPSESPLIAGAQVGLFRKDPQFRASWNDLQQKVAQLPDFPPDARALLDDADEIIVAGPTNLQGPAVFIGSTEQPYDPEKVKRLAKAGPPQVVDGQTVYPTENLVAGRVSFLALPSDRIIVLGLMPREDFAKLLAGAGKNRLHPDLQEQVDHAHTGFAWVAARFDDGVKQQMAQLNAQFGPMAFLFGPDVPNLIALTQRAKGALLSVDLGNQKLKLSVGVTCATEADAGQFKLATTNVWNGQAKILLGLAPLGEAFVPGLGKLAGEVEKSFMVEQKANTALLSVELNQDTLQELANAVQKKGFNAGGLPPFPLKK
jgi:hypothetical protein